MQILQWLSTALRIKSKTLNQALVYLPACHTTKARHTDFCPSFFNTQSYFLPGNLCNLTLTLYLPQFPSTFCQTSSYASRLTLNITNPCRSCVEIDSLYFTLILLSHNTLFFFSQQLAQFLNIYLFRRLLTILTISPKWTVDSKNYVSCSPLYMPSDQ